MFRNWIFNGPDRCKIQVKKIIKLFYYILTICITILTFFLFHYLFFMLSLLYILPFPILYILKVNRPWFGCFKRSLSFCPKKILRTWILSKPFNDKDHFWEWRKDAYYDKFSLSDIEMNKDKREAKGAERVEKAMLYGLMDVRTGAVGQSNR